MERISMKTRKEIILANKKAYQRASKKQKTQVINALVETTNLSRKYNTSVLNGNYIHEHSRNKSKRGGKPKDVNEHRKLILFICNVLNELSMFCEVACFIV